MHPITYRRLTAALFGSLVLFPSLLLFGQTPEKKDEKEKKKESEEEVVVLSPFSVGSSDVGYSASSSIAGTRLGATVGGAKDVRYFRDAATRGEFPHPNTITAEGLFSEYDLPLKSRCKSKDLLILNGEAIPASLLTQPEVRYLAQIGFSTGLDASTWQREPLNLVAVVDKSGSMEGPPLNLVKECLRKILSQLDSDDQLTIVVYGDSAGIHLEPTRTTARNHDRIEDAIDGIVSCGSTFMEAGLRLGFDVARRNQRNFHGRTRVMQFTDERPNVGDTSPEGFMGLMAAGSRDGIGQTTIGVGVQFGAELAAKVAAVRGGNLFFFPNVEEMENTFEDEFDTLVTELAYDLDMTIRPVAGLRLVGVYGIPGEMLKWEGDRNVRFQVTTLFPSKRRGAIYLAFAREADDLPARGYVEGTPLATVQLSYREIDSESPTRSKLDLPLVDDRDASLGLQRGRVLVSEYLALKSAMTAHLTENNQEKAYRILGELHGLLASVSDRSLRPERQLVAGLYDSMSQLAGHGNDRTVSDPFSSTDHYNHRRR